MLCKMSFGNLYNFLQYNKNLFLVFFTAVVLVGCTSPQKFIANMSGTWEDETSPGISLIYGPGIRSSEEWNVSDREDEAYGTAIIAENGELVFQEKFSLVKRDSGYYYLAYPRMVEEPTSFRLKKVNRNYLEVQNPQHDFPQVIIYHIRGDKVEITLRGEDLNKQKAEVSYTFTRKRH
jgi:hypothetical protein